MTRDWQNAGWPVVRIQDIGRLLSGGTPNRRRPEYFQGTIPWITGQDIPDNRVETIEKARDYVTEDAVSESATRVVPAGAVLITTRVSVGKTAVAGRPICFSQDVTALLIHSEAIAFPAYVAHFLRSRQPALLQKNQGSTIAGITRDSLALEQIPLPPLSEQQRIVEILQAAEAIRRLRAEAEAKTANLIPSLFLQMFGDPGQNPNKWSRFPLYSLAAKYSDGPFGSNLKSSHYTTQGVRVIRLQNIGIGKLLNGDEAFISEEHFESLSKHECLPGDVIIGTLGEPNLRAFVQPESLRRALNKADCVQFRPDLSRVSASYICWLLNMPGTLRMAQGLQAGQTRSRISMGRLGPLMVPCPPIELQQEFEKACELIMRSDETLEQSVCVERALTLSLSAHAFAGQLTAEWREANENRLAAEVRERDKVLRQYTDRRNVVATHSETETKAFASHIFQEPTDSVYSDLNREQRFVLKEIKRMVGGVDYIRYFNARMLGDYIDKPPLRKNPQAIEGHLAVLAARGLLIPVSREEQTEDTGEYLFGNAYRLPLNDTSDALTYDGMALTYDGAALTMGTHPGDHTRIHEMERLIGQLEKERSQQ